MDLLKRALDKPRSLTARSWLFQVHLWVGIFVGIYAILIGISGTILVFREEIVEMDTGRWKHVPVQPGAAYRPADEFLAAARHATGHKGQLTLELPQQPGDAVEANFYARNTMNYVFIDPYSGSVTQVIAHTPGLLRSIDTLHSNFFLKRPGRVMNGIGGLLLVLLCLTGICIWWPGRKLFRRRLTIDFGARFKRLNFDLHNSTGFWMMIGVFVISLTGAYFTWPQVFRSTVNSLFPLSELPKLKVERPPEASLRTLAELIAAADRAVPERPSWRVQISPNPNEPVRIAKRGDSYQPGRTATAVLLNPFTAEVLRVETYAAKTTGDRIMSWIGPLHTGHFGGMFVKIVYAILGLVFPLLFITGFIMWWDRVIMRRWRARRHIKQKETAPAAA